MDDIFQEGPWTLGGIDPAFAISWAERPGVGCDRFLILPISEQAMLVAVMDGAGREGGIAADIVREALPALFFRLRLDQPLEQKALRAALRHLFVALDQSVERVTERTTTLTLAIVRSNQVVLAHAGDSDAYLLRSGEEFLLPLTTPHNLETSGEFQALRELGGEMMGNYQVVALPNGGMAKSKLTRGLGAAPFGRLVRSEPDVLVRSIHPHDKFLLLMTDGFGTSLASRRSLNKRICHPPIPIGAEGCVRRLFHEARMIPFGDDTTVLAVDLAPFRC